MRIVLIGPGEVDGRSGVVWDTVRAVMQSLGPNDELVHTGGNGVGEKVDSISRRAKGTERRRLPKIAVQLPELGRYEREQAYRNNAMQLLGYQAPHLVVTVGDGLDDETKAVLDLRERAYRETIGVQDADEFVAERRRR